MARQIRAEPAFQIATLKDPLSTQPFSWQSLCMDQLEHPIAVHTENLGGLWHRHHLIRHAHLDVVPHP
jgi:hypothetical protein